MWASQQNPVGSTDEPARWAKHRFLQGCSWEGSSCCRRMRDPPSKIRNGSHWARDTQVKPRCCWGTGRQEKTPCVPWGGQDTPSPPSCYLETVLPDGYARTHPHRTQGTKGRRRAQGAEGAPAPRPWTGWDNTERPSSPRAGRPPELVKATKPQCQETQKRPGRINTPQWPQ